MRLAKGQTFHIRWVILKGRWYNWALRFPKREIPPTRTSVWVSDLNACSTIVVFRPDAEARGIGAARELNERDDPVWKKFGHEGERWSAAFMPILNPRPNSLSGHDWLLPVS